MPAHHSVLASVSGAKKREANATKLPIVIGPHYPNLKCHTDTLARHPARKGNALLGKAHPIEEISAPGRFQSHELNIFAFTHTYPVGDDSKVF
jgi:hypothetical protein